jgi:hypothetical protein
MNRIAALLCFGIALSPTFSAKAQENKPTPAELAEQAARAEQGRQELVNLENETVRALQQSNTTFFRRVYSDEFVGTGLGGQVMDKSALLAGIEASQAKYSSFIVSDIKVRIFENAGVVTCLWTAKGTVGSRPFSRQSRITHVYLYGSRGWKVIASQETLLPG